MNRLRAFARDLKRRRVFSTGAVYAVVAWAAVQGCGLVFPAFGAPAWMLRAVLMAAFAGFPIVMVLTWVFDIGSDGIRITDDADPAAPPRAAKRWLRPLIAAPILAIIVGGTVWLWSARLATSGDTQYTQQVRPDELPIVAVLPLENLTGRKELVWAGAGVSALVRDELAQSHYIAVVSAGRTLRLVSDNKDMQALLSRAAEDGITHVLSGEILRTPKGLTVTSRLTDLRRNVETSANRQEALQPEEALSASTSIASAVKQGLGLPGTEKVDVFAADFAAHNIPAYEAFIAGMQNFLNFDYADARRSFEIAVQKAPDFAMARYRLAHTLAALGDTDGAIAQVARARRDAARLSARERSYISAGEHYFKREYAKAEGGYRELLESHPYESEARLLLIYTLDGMDRYEEALVEAETLAAQDPGDEVAWSEIADLNLKLGHYDQADEALRKLIAISPDNPNAYYLLGESRFFRSQYDEAATQYQKAMQVDPSFGDAAIRLAHIDVLRNRPQSAIQRLQAMLTTGSFAPSLRISAAFDLASLLRAQDRCPEALLALDRVQADIAAEQVREALELATRSRCLLDTRQIPQALQLAAESVAKSPGNATRYLFARGLAEIEAGDVVAAGKTIVGIRALISPTESDHREQKAADYLQGLLRMQQGDVAGAVPLLRSAVAANGYEYDVYALALARALARQGDTREARTLALKASERRNPADLRLDLERTRRDTAQLLMQLGG